MSKVWKHYNLFMFLNVVAFMSSKIEWNSNIVKYHYTFSI